MLFNYALGDVRSALTNSVDTPEDEGRGMRGTFVFVLVAVVTMMALAGPARADATADDVAALRERGNAAMRSGRPADALDAYERIYAATHDPAMLYNMARAHQALTSYAEASDLLVRFKAEAPPETLAKVSGLDRLVAELAARIHTLTLRCSVEGAEVRVGGKIVGTTPLAKPLRVNAGRTDLDVRAEGHAPFTRSLELAGGASSEIDVDLVRADRSGVLLVRSPQAGASVFVDGRPVGEVPVEIALTAGEHEVRVTRPGFQESRSRVLVVAGQRKETSIELASTPSVFTRWWFWGGVAVVAAGGVATYIALTTEKDAPVGSISPGQVSLRGFSF